MIRGAVLGKPISHSLSPLLHTTAYQELGVGATYEKIEVSSGDLVSFLNGLDDSWNAFSLTMPLKEEVLEVADHLSELALRIKSANTLHRVDQEWFATSTDIDGFRNSLLMHEINFSSHVVIIGAGATARAAAAACDGTAAHITVINRSTARTADMQKSVVESPISFVDWSNCSIINNADLVINTTPGHAADILISDLSANISTTYFESLYNPWPTQLAEQWSARGGQVIDGLDLLIHQALVQIEMFSGQEFDRQSMYSLLRTVGVNALK